jgi:hypothetical protein
MNYEDILKRKYPTADWSISDPTDYDTIEWNETQWPKPTKAWFEQKAIKIANILQNEIAEQHRYAGKQRKQEYPAIEEQLDMLWHAMANDSKKRLEPFYSTIKAIKDKYPKT